METKKSNKEYINGSGRIHIFKDGNSVINMYVKKSELMALPENESGYIRFIIGEKNGPDQFKNTHYIYKDTFVPDSSKGSGKSESKSNTSAPPKPTPKTDDLPF